MSVTFFVPVEVVEQVFPLVVVLSDMTNSKFKYVSLVLMENEKRKEPDTPPVKVRRHNHSWSPMTSLLQLWRSYLWRIGPDLSGWEDDHPENVCLDSLCPVWLVSIVYWGKSLLFLTFPFFVAFVRKRTIEYKMTRNS